MTSKNYIEKWNRIKVHYELLMPEIMSAKVHEYGIDPYAWNCEEGMVDMTPIEWAMWQDIRATGLVMYPQFPVCGFFVDFGNPVAKVAIECDGVMWHDKKRDEWRDGILKKHGWHVYRMIGRDCKKTYPDADGRHVKSPAEELCIEIGNRHGMFAKDEEDDMQEIDCIDSVEIARIMKQSIQERIARAERIGASAMGSVFA